MRTHLHEGVQLRDLVRVGTGSAARARLALEQAPARLPHELALLAACSVRCLVVLPHDAHEVEERCQLVVVDLERHAPVFVQALLQAHRE